MSDLRQRLERELRGNILPFWMEHVVDPQSGGFYGRLDNDLTVRNEVERSAVLLGRLLWTFSAAFRQFGDRGYEATARRAYDYLQAAFRDHQHGGVYWSVDAGGRPVNDRKHVYAQAFVMYGLAEYVAATGNAGALTWAQELFGLVERHTHDDEYGGNIECRVRDWSPLADMRLSDKEPPAAKTMNTLLHLMEAYTGLRWVWNDPMLKARHEALIRVFLDFIARADTQVDPGGVHRRGPRFRLFFDRDWQALPDHVSPGHDIEGSWLLVEAANLADDRDLITRVSSLSLKMASRVLQAGLDEQGYVVYQAGDHWDGARHWWPQAEGMVGFWNAYQLSARREFEQASLRLWDLMEATFVDRTHGEWFKIIRPDGTPDLSQPKTGPWECPYHHSRAIMEMLRRLD